MISQRYGRSARPAIQEVQQRIAELTADAEENISGVRVVKSFARESHQLERFRHSVGARVRPGDGRDAPGGELQPDDRLPAPARARRRAADRRQERDPPPPQPRAVHAVLPLPEHADRADALARRDARPRAARDRLGRAHLPGARPRAAHRRAPGRPAAAGRQRPRAAARRDAALRRKRRVRRGLRPRRRPRGRASSSKRPRATAPARTARAAARAALRDVDLDVRGRHDGRAGRRHRLGQDEPRLADLAPV